MENKCIEMNVVSGRTFSERCFHDGRSGPLFRGHHQVPNDSAGLGRWISHLRHWYRPHPDMLGLGSNLTHLKKMSNRCVFFLLLRKKCQSKFQGDPSFRPKSGFQSDSIRKSASKTPESEATLFPGIPFKSFGELKPWDSWRHGTVPDLDLEVTTGMGGAGPSTIGVGVESGGNLSHSHDPPCLRPWKYTLKAQLTLGDEYGGENLVPL